MQRTLPYLILACFWAFSPVLTAQPKLQLVSYASGFVRPVDIAHCGDSRLFVVEQRGLIWILDSLGNKLPVPFLDIDARVRSTANEQGLLGLAFPPDYAQSGVFYVYYTREPDGATRVSRFSVQAADPNVADPNSEEILLAQSQPYNNHNGGGLKFGPNDGYLYISLGDGGSGGDPQNYGQTKNTLLGKILRIDVNTTSPGLAYGIPADNPFVNDPAFRPEIWSWGWRNPWRFSFDRLTGDMWIGDVGQSTREEIDFEPAGVGGRNYGWRCYEGTFPYNTAGCQPASAYTSPVFDYDNNSLGCSVTGGFLYRGSQYPDLYGYYLFTDYCSGRWWGTRQLPDGTFTTDFLIDLTNNQYSAFGEDRNGELYIAALSQGQIYRITERCSSFQVSGAVTNAVCHGTFSGIIDLSITGGTAPYTFQWNIPQTDSTVVYLDPGVYTVTVEDAQGCIRRDTFTVGADTLVPTPGLNVLSWTAPLPEPVLLCPGSDTVYLETQTAPAGYGYRWFRDKEEIIGATGQVFAAVEAGVYHAAYQGNLCASPPSGEIAISVVPAEPVPTVVNTGPSLLCPGQQTVLEAGGIPNGLDLQWLLNGQPISGANAPQLVVTEAGSYSAQIQYAGCLFAPSTPLIIVQEAQPPVLELFFVDGVLSVSTGGWSGYQWLLNGQMIPGATDSVYLPVENGLYACMLVSQNGCLYQPSLQVDISSAPDLPRSVQKLWLSPNPTNNTVQLILELSQSEQGLMGLQDSRQRQIFTKSIQGQRIADTIDLTHLPAGTYYLYFQLESGRFVRPLVRN